MYLGYVHDGSKEKWRRSGKYLQYNLVGLTRILEFSGLYWKGVRMLCIDSIIKGDLWRLFMWKALSTYPPRPILIAVIYIMGNIFFYGSVTDAQIGQSSLLRSWLILWSASKNLSLLKSQDDWAFGDIHTECLDVHTENRCWHLN